jgi:hypothetical protein
MAAPETLENEIFKPLRNAFNSENVKKRWGIEKIFDTFKIFKLKTKHRWITCSLF